MAEEKVIMYVGVNKDLKPDVENKYFDYTSRLGPLAEAELFTEAYIAHTKICPNCAEDIPKNLEFIPVEVKLIK